MSTTPPRGITPPRGSAANPERPRLSPGIERQLEPVDRRSAEGYEAAEQAIRAMDDVLEGDGAVVHLIDSSDSVIHSLRAAHKATRPADEK
jgi:hypothetical protein